MSSATVVEVKDLSTDGTESDEYELVDDDSYGSESEEEDTTCQYYVAPLEARVYAEVVSHPNIRGAEHEFRVNPSVANALCELPAPVICVSAMGETDTGQTVFLDLLIQSFYREPKLSPFRNANRKAGRQNGRSGPTVMVWYAPLFEVIPGASGTLCFFDAGAGFGATGTAAAGSLERSLFVAGLSDCVCVKYRAGTPFGNDNFERLARLCHLMSASASASASNSNSNSNLTTVLNACRPTLAVIAHDVPCLPDSKRTEQISEDKICSLRKQFKVEAVPTATATVTACTPQDIINREFQYKLFLPLNGPRSPDEMSTLIACGPAFAKSALAAFENIRGAIRRHYELQTDSVRASESDIRSRLRAALDRLDSKRLSYELNEIDYGAIRRARNQFIAEYWALMGVDPSTENGFTRTDGKEFDAMQFIDRHCLVVAPQLLFQARMELSANGRYPIQPNSIKELRLKTVERWLAVALFTVCRMANATDEDVRMQFSELKQSVSALKSIQSENTIRIGELQTIFDGLELAVTEWESSLVQQKTEAAKIFLPLKVAAEQYELIEREVARTLQFGAALATAMNETANQIVEHKRAQWDAYEKAKKAKRKALWRGIVLGVALAVTGWGLAALAPASSLASTVGNAMLGMAKTAAINQATALLPLPEGMKHVLTVGAAVLSGNPQSIAAAGRQIAIEAAVQKSGQLLKGPAGAALAGAVGAFLTGGDVLSGAVSAGAAAAAAPTAVRLFGQAMGGALSSSAGNAAGAISDRVVSAIATPKIADTKSQRDDKQNVSRSDQSTKSVAAVPPPAQNPKPKERTRANPKSGKTEPKQSPPNDKLKPNQPKVTSPPTPTISAAAPVTNLGSSQTGASTQPVPPAAVASPPPGPSFWSQALSFGLDCTPVIGSLKAAEQMWTGVDSVTGEPVCRWIEGIGILCPIAAKGIKGGKALYKASKLVDAAATAAATAKKAPVLKAGEAVTSGWTHVKPQHHSSNLARVDGFKKRGIQDHHIVPNRFRLHPAWEHSGLSIENRSNKILLPTPKAMGGEFGARASHGRHGVGYDHAMQEMLDYSLTLSPSQAREFITSVQTRVRAPLRDGTQALLVTPSKVQPGAKFAPGQVSEHFRDLMQ